MLTMAGPLRRDAPALAHDWLADGRRSSQYGAAGFGTARRVSMPLEGRQTMPDWLSERTILLFLHIGSAILFLGPATVATSLFPRYAQLGDAAVGRVLHRVSDLYGWLSLLVAVFGIVLAARYDLFDQPWVSVSFVLLVVAIVLLAAVILPGQRRALRMMEAGPADRAVIGRLRAASGGFALAWLIILFLMVAKPG